MFGGQSQIEEIDNIAKKNMATMVKVAALFFFPISLASSEIASIREYKPQHDVSSYLALSEDLRAMDQALAAGGKEGFQNARDIYMHGAFAEPVATIQVSEGLPFDLRKGTILNGIDNAGQPITVGVHITSHKKGDKSIEIAFLSDKTCRRYRSPNPDQSGCLVPVGELSVTGQSQKIEYFYALSDIRNFHSIQKLSQNAHSKFRPNGNTHTKFFKDFQKYVDFFGVADFGDQIIMAVFNHNKYVGKHLELDFVDFNDEARRSMIVHTAAFLIIILFVEQELETAVSICDHSCGASGCNTESIRSLDAAVALYSGLAFDEIGTSELMYDLSNKMCQAFRTCGADARVATGTSKINIDIFQEFHAMQKNFDSSSCLEAKMNKEAIAKKMAVPLIQATLWAVDLDARTDQIETRSSRVAYSTAVLPLLSHCDPVQTLDLVQQTNSPEALTEGAFEQTKLLVESQYRCLDITCKDVGGLWDASAGDYEIGARSCDVSEEKPTSDETSKRSLKIILPLSFLLFFLSTCLYCVRRRNRRRSASSNDDDDSDNSDDSDDSDDENKHRIT